jgi:hypothetical protein
MTQELTQIKFHHLIACTWCPETTRNMFKLRTVKLLTLLLFNLFSFPILIHMMNTVTDNCTVT